MNNLFDGSQPQLFEEELVIQRDANFCNCLIGGRKRVGIPATIFWLPSSYILK